MPLTVAAPPIHRRVRFALVALVGAIAVLSACAEDDDAGVAPPVDDVPETPVTGEPTDAAAPFPRALGTAAIPYEPPDEEPDEEPETSDREPVAELQVGDCVDLPGRDDGTETDEVPLRDCDEDHDAEVFARVSLDDDPESPHPGDEAVTATAEDVCFDAFEPYVGVAYLDSGLEIAFYRPNEAAWVRGDRSVVCLLFSPDGERLSGSVTAE